MKIKLLRGANINGQSLLVKTDGGTNVMIDAGMDMKNNKPLPLDGVEKVDYLFVTHAHLDHSGDAPEVLARCGGRFFCNEETEALMNVLFKDKIYQKTRLRVSIPNGVNRHEPRSNDDFRNLSVE